MSHIYIASRTGDRDALLAALRDLGVVHIRPVVDRKASITGVASSLHDIDRALQILSGIPPAEQATNLSPTDAVREVLRIHREAGERKSRLTTLEHQLPELEIWGDTNVEAIAALHRAPVQLRFFEIPIEDVRQISASHVVMLRAAKDKALVAVIPEEEEPHIPDSAILLPPPPQDRPSLLAEAAEIDAASERDGLQLRRLAAQLYEIRSLRAEMMDRADWEHAQRSALSSDHLFALQGWVPTARADALTPELEKRGIPAAIELISVTEEDHPPTLIEAPRWARPINGLFKMLGTVAGYREFDVSAAFMIALPLFAAILISDGGYGALLLCGPLLFHRRFTDQMGEDFTRLLVVIGGVAVGWGSLCATFFGFVLFEPLIPVDLSEYSRILMMRISFVIGAVHLSLAQSWQALLFFPDMRFLNRAGWAVFIWGMFGVVGHYVLGDPFGWATVWPYLLLFGAGLATGFASTEGNALKRLGLGIADFPLSTVSAFSDVISYVRLMAVALATTVLAQSFNDMALGMGHWLPALLILAGGHALNFALVLIALFAHGVRLNMLEFSGNLGMQWTGYPFEPFGRTSAMEQQA